MSIALAETPYPTATFPAVSGAERAVSNGSLPAVELPAVPPPLAPIAEDNDTVVYEFAGKTFRLNKAKARERLAGKKVINGHKSAELNVLPLKYHEAYRIYKQMKAN